MQLVALFTLLPLLANAVPLNLGGLLLAPCKATGCTWSSSSSATNQAAPTTNPNNILDVKLGNLGVGIGLGGAASSSPQSTPAASSNNILDLNLGKLGVGIGLGGAPSASAAATAPSPTPNNILDANIGLGNISVDVGVGIGGPPSPSAPTPTPSSTSSNILNADVDVGNISVGVGIGIGGASGAPLPGVPGAPAPKVSSLTGAVPSVVADVPDVVSAVPSIISAAPSVVSSIPVVSDMTPIPSNLPTPILDVGAGLGVDLDLGLGTSVGSCASPSLPSFPSLPSDQSGSLLDVDLDLGLGLGGAGGSLPSGNGLDLGNVIGGLVGGGSSSGSLSPVLDKLSDFLNGLTAPSALSAIVQLNTMIGHLQQACNEQAGALKGQLDLARVVAYVVALIRNISTCLNALPSWILTNGTIKSCAASVDNLLTAYIHGLQVIGLSTAAFVDQANKQGLDLSGFSPLLVKTCALFPGRY